MKFHVEASVGQIHWVWREHPGCNFAGSTSSRRRIFAEESETSHRVLSVRKARIFKL